MILFIAEQGTSLNYQEMFVAFRVLWVRVSCLLLQTLLVNVDLNQLARTTAVALVDQFCGSKLVSLSMRGKRENAC